MRFDGRALRMPSRIGGMLMSLWLLLPSLAVEASAVELVVLPRSCIPARDEPVCVRQILVRWGMETAEAFCFWQRGATEPLFCDQRERGERVVPISIQQTTYFDALAETTGVTLASAEIVVLASATVKQRRRYQHPWSIF